MVSKVKKLEEENARLREELARVREELRRAVAEQSAKKRGDAGEHTETLLSLARAAESRDHDTAGHIARTGYFTALIASALGMSEAESRLMMLAASMHDIGKIGIPDAILKKQGRLTREERRIMQKHPEQGARILEGCEAPALRLAAEIALTHHEKFDGSGYPRELAGDAIPIGARIVAVADVFDAIALNHRSYRRAIPLDQAFDEIQKGRGQHFDPEVVDAFFKEADRVADATARFENGEPLSGMSALWTPST